MCRGTVLQYHTPRLLTVILPSPDLPSYLEYPEGGREKWNAASDICAHCHMISEERGNRSRHKGDSGVHWFNKSKQGDKTNTHAWDMCSS